MNKKHPIINRRKFLRNAGIAVGGASVGVSGTVAGRQHGNNVTGREVKEVLNEGRVRNLLNELGDPPLKRGKAALTTQSLGVTQVSVMVIPSQVGSLAYFESDNGIKQAFFLFGSPKENGRIPPGFLKKLPEEYRDLPAAGKGVLTIGPDGEPILNRGPSVSQSASTAGFSTAQVSTDDLPDVVERFDIYPPVSIGPINGCNVATGYTHQYSKVSFELTDPADSLSKGVLAEIVSTLASAVLVGGIAGLILGILLGAIIGTLLAVGTSDDYTIGFRDDDLDYLIGETGQLVAAVANEYDAPVENTLYAGSAPGFHLLRGRV